MTTQPLPPPSVGWYYPDYFQKVINAIRHRSNPENLRYQGATATRSIDPCNGVPDGAENNAKLPRSNDAKKTAIIAKVN